MDELCASDFFKHEAGQVLRGVGACGHIAHFAGVGFGVGHQLFHRLHRQRRVDHDGNGCARCLQDGREVALVVKGHAFEHMGLQNLRRKGAQQGVAIGCRFGHHVGTYDARSAGAVFDHHRLTHQLSELDGHGPVEHIQATTGRIGHHQAHRFAGVVLGPAVGGGQAQSRGSGQQSAALHSGLMPAETTILRNTSVSALIDWVNSSALVVPVIS